MAISMQPAQQKLAEKLIILNDRGIGLLTRLYNIKKACSDANKPIYFTEKSLEPCIKLIVKKFPSIDIKGNMNTLSPICALKQEILKNLNQYYFTFVDILDFKDHVTELLTNIDTAQMNFDIVIYFDITKLYLDLISTYISLIFLLNAVDDRKALIGLYNTAKELTNSMGSGSNVSSLPIIGGSTNAKKLSMVGGNLYHSGSMHCYRSLYVVKILANNNTDMSPHHFFKEFTDYMNILHRHLLRDNSTNPYPRLAQTVAEYDGPEAALKKLQEEFSPHSRLIVKCLTSLTQVFPRRNLTALEWRSAQMLSLVASSQHLLTPAQTDTIPCEYLSLESMEKWILLCGLICHSAIANDPDLWELWKQSLRANLVVPLFRDETLNVYTLVTAHFEGIKGYNKRVAEVKECYQYTIQDAIKIRRERRKFLRVTLKELIAMFSDQPGLLGPKALYVFMALSFTRDEIVWLLRHQEFCINISLSGTSNPSNSSTTNNSSLGALNAIHPSLVSSTKKVGREDFTDRILPELLFYVEELKALVVKYRQVLQRYYVQYLAGYDAMEFKRLLQTLSFCQEEESIIITSFDDTLTKMSLERLRDQDALKEGGSSSRSPQGSVLGQEEPGSGSVKEPFFPELAALRLDWMRLQAYSLPNKATFSLVKHPEFAKQLNMITFHTKMVDNLDSMVTECSDLSLFCFYPGLLEENFRLGLEFPPQMRFIISFPMICSHFLNACHEMCPEEKPQVADRSLMFTNMFLEDVSKEIRTIVAYICEDYCLMNDQVGGKKKGNNKNASSTTGLVGLSSTSILASGATGSSANSSGFGNQQTTSGPIGSDENKPGSESYRKYREELNVLDIQYTALTELCTAIDYRSTLVVSRHTFSSREYLNEQLELYFNKSIVAMAMYNLGSTEIARPSEVLSRVRTCMSLLFHTMDNFVHVDIAKVMKNVLLQQTQPLDNHGEKTITSIYTIWYLEIFLRRSISNPTIFSDFYKCFVTLGQDDQMKFSTDEYVEYCELRSLAELLTAYGMRHLSEQFMRHVASQMMELRKIVVAQRDTLITLRTNFEDASRLRDFYKRMAQGFDGILQRIILIGKLITFNSLAMEALNDVLRSRAPFLLTSITDFQNVNANSDLNVVNEMATVAGIESPVNPFLIAAFKQNIDYKSDDEYENTCLLMVLIALSFPRLVRNDLSGGTLYQPFADGTKNNSHCIAKGLDTVFSTLFHLHGKNDIKDRMKEFLALTSSCLLKVCHDTEKENISRHRDGVCLILEQIVNQSSHLSYDLLDACFPYILVRNACRNIYKNYKL